MLYRNSSYPSLLGSLSYPLFGRHWSST